MSPDAKVFQASFIPQFLIEIFLLWFIDSVKYIVFSTYGFVLLIADMFALSVLLKTFFLPYRAENRKGFIAIAIGIGILVRLISIITCLILMLFAVIIGFVTGVFWILIPLIIVYLMLSPLIRVF